MFKLSRGTRNWVTSCAVMFLVNLAYGPATVIENVVITDSSGLAAETGYLGQGIHMSASFVAGLLFTQLNKLLNIKVMFGLSTVLILPYFLAMIWLNSYVLYVSKFFSGLALGFLWIILPKTISDDSREDKIQRNVSIFMIVYSTASMIGGVINYLYLSDMTTITPTVRITMYSVCGVIGAVGAVVGVLFIQPTKPLKHEQSVPGGQEIGDTCVGSNSIEMDTSFVYTKVNDTDTSQSKEQENGDTHTEVTTGNDIQKIINNTDHHVEESFVNDIKYLLKMARHFPVWGMLLYVINCGVIWAFFGRILPTATGAVFTERGLVAIMTLYEGGSYIVGSFGWERLTKYTNNTLALCIITVSLLLSTILAYLIFPYDANINPETTATSLITPQPYLVYIVATLLCLADAGYTIICFAAVNKVFKGRTGLGFAMLNNGFCIANAATMFVVPYVTLHAFLYFQAATILCSGIAWVFGMRNSY